MKRVSFFIKQMYSFMFAFYKFLNIIDFLDQKEEK